MRFLKIEAVLAATGMARSTLYLAIKLGRFPAPVKIGPRASAWDSREIDAWMASRIEARDVQLAALDARTEAVR